MVRDCRDVGAKEASQVIFGMSVRKCVPKQKRIEFGRCCRKPKARRPDARPRSSVRLVE